MRNAQIWYRVHIVHLRMFDRCAKIWLLILLSRDHWCRLPVCVAGGGGQRMGGGGQQHGGGGGGLYDGDNNVLSLDDSSFPSSSNGWVWLVSWAGTSGQEQLGQGFGGRVRRVCGKGVGPCSSRSAVPQLCS
jgi:hypothetical protein